MAEAEVPEVQSYDVPSRLLGKDGRPAPHVTAEKYQTDYPQSIENTDEFFGKVSRPSVLTQAFGSALPDATRSV